MTQPRIVLTRLRRLSHHLPRLILFAVLLAACAPATSTVTPVQPEAAEPSPTALPAVSATAVLARATDSPTEALVATAIPAATSRGPDLHATDPSTVNLASGGLQLVEFFRFT